MPNIMISDICNLNCSYCFVQEIVNDKKHRKKHISIKDFREIIDFITKTHDRVGILGGEPTLHPKIKEIVDHLIKNEKLNHAILYSNGICLERVIDQLGHPKIETLINLNSPQDIGKENYKKIIKNLDKLYFQKYNDSFKLGINIYKENFDYKYIIDALQRYEKKTLRIAAIIAPYNKKTRKKNYLEYCRKMKASILDFYKELYKLKITPKLSCSGNVIPPCLYTKKENDFLKKFVDLVSYDKSSYDKSETNIMNFSCCSPMIEFTTDKKVARCLPLSIFEKVDMKNFQNINEIKGYFRNKYDIFKHIIPIDEKCRNCIYMTMMYCQGGCIAYKINEINKARKIIKSMRKAD